MLMERYNELMTDNNVKDSFSLSVTANEEKPGFFLIHPVGSFNTNTYMILKNKTGVGS